MTPLGKDQVERLGLFLSLIDQINPASLYYPSNF